MKSFAFYLFPNSSSTEEYIFVFNILHKFKLQWSHQNNCKEGEKEEFFESHFGESTDRWAVLEYYGASLGKCTKSTLNNGIMAAAYFLSALNVRGNQKIAPQINFQCDRQPLLTLYMFESILIHDNFASFQNHSLFNPKLSAWYIQRVFGSYLMWHK